MLFNARQWPDGFVFPACVLCNRVTRDDEQILALLARVYPDAATESERREMQERMRAVAKNFPEILHEMTPTARQLRDARKKYGLKPPHDGSLRDLPLLSLRGKRLNQSVLQFGRKLALALFYKHTKNILPVTGSIALRWYSNLQIDADEIPRELADVLTQFPPLVRNNTNLGDQFFYRLGVADTRELLAFLALFRRSFGIFGTVVADGSKLTLPEGVEQFGPFNWATDASAG